VGNVITRKFNPLLWIANLAGCCLLQPR